MTHVQGSPPRWRAWVYVVIAALLGSQFIGLLWVSSYAKVAPQLGGFPFFYWYSLLWLLIGAVEMAIAHLLLGIVERARR